MKHALWETKKQTAIINKNTQNYVLKRALKRIVFLTSGLLHNKNSWMPVSECDNTEPYLLLGWGIALLEGSKRSDF